MHLVASILTGLGFCIKDHTRYGRTIIFICVFWTVFSFCTERLYFIPGWRSVFISYWHCLFDLCLAFWHDFTRLSVGQERLLVFNYSHLLSRKNTNLTRSSIGLSYVSYQYSQQLGLKNDVPDFFDAQL